jgi:hypothetical protein
MLSVILPLTFAIIVPIQDTAKPTAYKPNPDAVRARDMYADLRLLDSLLPLELTKDQIKQLLVPMKAAQKEYEGLLKQGDDAAKGLADALTEARNAAIEGKKAPAELSKKIDDLGKAAETRQVTAYQKSVESTLAVTLKVLTAPQKGDLLRQSEKAFGGKRVPKAFQSNPEKAPKDQVEALALIEFVKGVLLIDRTIVLMEAMAEKK